MHSLRNALCCDTVPWGLLWRSNQNICPTGEFNFGDTQIGLQVKSQFMWQMWQDFWSWKEIHTWFPAFIAGRWCCQGHLLDFHTSTEYARKTRGHPDMQNKTRCCLVFSGGGEFWRAIRHRVKVLIALHPHCCSSCTALSLHAKPVMAWWKRQQVYFFFTPSFALFLPFRLLLSLVWVLFSSKKQNRTKQKNPKDMVTILWVDIQNAKKKNSPIFV